MSRINLKPTHKVITDYYAALHNYSQLGFFNEGSVSPPFAEPLQMAPLQKPARSKGVSLAIQLFEKFE